MTAAKQLYRDSSQARRKGCPVARGRLQSYLQPFRWARQGPGHDGKSLAGCQSHGTARTATVVCGSSPRRRDLTTLLQCLKKPGEKPPPAASRGGLPDRQQVSPAPRTRRPTQPHPGGTPRPRRPLDLTPDRCGNLPVHPVREFGCTCRPKPAGAADGGDLGKWPGAGQKGRWAPVEGAGARR